MNVKDLGARLRQARMSAGLSKSQAVRRLGPTLLHADLVRIEEGAVEPTDSQIARCCAVYHIRHAWLFETPVHIVDDVDALMLLQDGTITGDQFMAYVCIFRGLRLGRIP